MIAGSFFYSLVYRYSSDMIKNNPLRSLFSRSICPHCSKTLQATELIPLLSFIIQKGRCRECGNNISREYPTAEIFYALITILTCARLGPKVTTILPLLLIYIALTIAIVDLKTQTIPDSLLLVFFLTALTHLLTAGFPEGQLWGVLITGGIFYIIAFFIPGSFGGGDIKYGAVIGFFLGRDLSIVCLEVALITGAVAGSIYCLLSNSNLKSKIAFGPFLSTGLITAILYGNEIVILYDRIIR